MSSNLPIDAEVWHRNDTNGNKILYKCSINLVKDVSLMKGWASFDPVRSKSTMTEGCCWKGGEPEQDTVTYSFNNP